MEKTLQKASQWTLSLEYFLMDMFPQWEEQALMLKKNMYIKHRCELLHMFYPFESYFQLCHIVLSINPDNACLYGSNNAVNKNKLF